MDLVWVTPSLIPEPNITDVEVECLCLIAVAAALHETNPRRNTRHYRRKYEAALDRWIRDLASRR
jgi:hypothetical protein